MNDQIEALASAAGRAVGMLVALGAMGPSLAAAQTAVTIEAQRVATSVRLQAVSVATPRIVWASGVGGTWARTSDGGASWVTGVVTGADSLEFRDVHAFDERHAVLLAAGPGDRSRVYRTEDGGATWTLAFTNPDPAAFYDCMDFRGSYGVAVSDAVRGRFPLIRTRNGGRSWEPFEPLGYDAVRAIDGEGAFAASGTCLELTDGGLRIGTAKGGRVITFTPRGAEATETPVERNLPTAGIASITFRSSMVGVVAGGDIARLDAFVDNVAVTRDGGRNWTLGGRPPFPGPVYGLAYGTARGGRQVLVAVGPAGAAWSPDDGASWRLLSNDGYWSLAFAPTGVGWLVGPAGRISRISVR
jgi:photosystem II stability/assembly factor-like uncharacterized protein